MSHVRRETVQDLAESMGHALPAGVAEALAPDVEYRTREVVQEALKFMRHAKRRRLAAEDVNAALRLRNREALYGFADEATFKVRGRAVIRAKMPAIMRLLSRNARESYLEMHGSDEKHSLL